jgi:uncharacterized protein YukE
MNPLDAMHAMMQALVRWRRGAPIASDGVFRVEERASKWNYQGTSVAFPEDAILDRIDLGRPERLSSEELAAMSSTQMTYELQALRDDLERRVDRLERELRDCRSLQEHVEGELARERETVRAYRDEYLRLTSAVQAYVNRRTIHTFSTLVKVLHQQAQPRESSEVEK